MSDLLAPSGKVIRPPWYKPDASHFAVTMPVQSLQALFELISFLGLGEFEAKLRLFTDLSDREIAERVKWLDALYEYLGNQGLHPHKVKKDYVKQVRKWAKQNTILMPR